MAARNIQQLTFGVPPPIPPEPERRPWPEPEPQPDEHCGRWGEAPGVWRWPYYGLICRACFSFLRADEGYRRSMEREFGG